MTNAANPSFLDAQALLRQLKVFEGDLQPFDVTCAPDDPFMLFDAWFRAAIAGGAVEPHAMTLSTVDEAGWPSSRTLILKDFDDNGLFFASSAASRKGAEIAAQPRAALNFYWREFGRQIRVRGEVTPCGAERSRKDFAARSIEARAEALLGRQSQRLNDRNDWEQAINAARQRMDEEPSVIAKDWTLYVLRPREFEFWQADRGRRHDRLQYMRNGDAWSHQMLWP